MVLLGFCFFLNAFSYDILGPNKGISCDLKFVSKYIKAAREYRNEHMNDHSRSESAQIKKKSWYYPPWTAMF